MKIETFLCILELDQLRLSYNTGIRYFEIHNIPIIQKQNHTSTLPFVN